MTNFWMPASLGELITKPRTDMVGTRYRNSPLVFGNIANSSLYSVNVERSPTTATRCS